MKRRYYIGPGAASLLLVVVVVSMSALGLLALMSARSDARLAERSREFTVQEYAASVRSEEMFAALDAALANCARTAADDAGYLQLVEQNLPEEMALDGRNVYWTLPAGDGRELSCAAEIAPLGEFPRCHWMEHSYYAQTEDIFF